MKRPVNKKSAACIAIATSAALCATPVVAFADDDTLANPDTPAAIQENVDGEGGGDDTLANPDTPAAIQRNVDDDVDDGDDDDEDGDDDGDDVDDGDPKDPTNPDDPNATPDSEDDPNKTPEGDGNDGDEGDKTPQSEDDGKTEPKPLVEKAKVAPNKLVQTGDETSVAGFSLVALISAAAAALGFRKRNSNDF